MKITKKNTKNNFEPIRLEIVIENQEELDAFNKADGGLAEGCIIGLLFEHAKDAETIKKFLDDIKKAL